MNRNIKKLKRWANRRGADIIDINNLDEEFYEQIIEDDQVVTWLDNPGLLGVDWEARKVYYDPRKPIDEYDANVVHWSEVVHELGHILAEKKPPWKPHDESVWHIWEYALVKKLGLSVRVWEDKQRDLDLNVYYGYLDREEKDQYLKEQWEVATKTGLIKQGWPQVIRKPALAP